MTVGTIVRLKRACLGNDDGTLGVGFNDYGSGCQFIFANGEYDGFSLEEQKMFLEEVGFSEEVSGYQFRSVMYLSDDFRRGVFNSALK